MLLQYFQTTSVGSGREAGIPGGRRSVQLLLLALYVLLPLALCAQQRSSLRVRTVAVLPAGQLVDTLSIAPGSLTVTPQTPHRLSGRFLYWTTTELPDSVTLTYRVLPFTLDRRVSRLDTSLLRTEAAGLVIGSYEPYQRRGLLDDDGKVQTAGSFTRGISFGNRQDLVLNSAFNLQLNGELGNGIEVAAAITDENLPVQPEGTTQQLREFDRIFIQLRKNNSQLTAGDYELRNPEGYFQRYFKKLEGATFTQADEQWTNTASVAVARGQFIRQNIVPGEGNQGPYKLTGAADGGPNRFLIVLAGTERIYLDGELLQRGLDADYVIDYNLAELTFTANRLITRDSRIVAEYEYADQRYLRTLTAGGSRFEHERFSAYVNLYSQQDSRTATGDLELNGLQREALALAGDDPEGITISSIDTLDGREELRSTYTLTTVDDPCTRRQAQILVSSDTGRYVATFTDRGPGGGSYELVTDRQDNERIYRYVGFDPTTCAPLGRYAPEIDLVAPRQQQMVSVGGSYRLGENGSLRAEGSRSRLDLNRFSELNASDDVGHALRVDADRSFRLGADSSGWTLAPRGYYELLEQTFTTINPYRSPEFYRDWNLSNRLSTIRPAAARESLIGGGIAIARAGVGAVDYEVGSFVRGDGYRGLRHAATLAADYAGWRAAGSLSVLDSEDEESRGSLSRPAIRLAKRIDALYGLTLAADYRGERSLRRDRITDTLSPFSFRYDRFKLSLQLPAKENYALEISASQRDDYLPDGTELLASTVARELAATGNYRAGRNLRLGGNFTLRDLEVPGPELVDDNPTRTFLGRFDVQTEALKRALTTQTTYQVGSGQEPRVEFQYLYVGPGLGQYIWQDSLFNNDGRIQPNEVVLSPFADIADYVRVSVFNNEFIRTDNVSINQRVNWDPSRLWRGSDGAKDLLSRIALNTILNIDRKTTASPEVQSWNPFQLAVADSSLTALSLRRRHGLFFNRANPRYDVQLSNGEQRSRRVLTTGYESSRREDWTLRLRYRPHDQLSIEAEGSSGRRSADSERFDEKDFEIEFDRIEPSLNWQPGEFRFEVAAALGRETNVLRPVEAEREATLRRELKFGGSYANGLEANLQYIDITFEAGIGRSNSPVGFALLQGLQPGRNLLWNVNFTRDLGQYLQLNLSYDGRKTGEAATVHVGRARVTARF